MKKINEETKKYLKKRVDIRCKCKKQKSNEKDRVKYGTCRCDSFSMDYTLGHIIANSLYEYIAHAKVSIIREDFEILEKHAESIRNYIEADSLDGISKEKGVKIEFLKKEKEFKKAMKYITDNWHSLWW